MLKAPDLPPLYPIVDVDVAARAGWAPLALARAYLAGGAGLLQLRAKQMDSGPLLDLAVEMADVVHRAGGRLIVNDRADVARLARADGVHVGQDDLAPQDVRRIVGDEMIVGLSTHGSAQYGRAVREPISYVAIGPVFPTSTKKTGYDRVGYDAVRAAAAVAAPHGLPVVAIGGITLDTARLVIEAGATSLAVITDLVTSDPEARIRQYLAALAL